jgi:hypothetical protein
VSATLRKLSLAHPAHVTLDELKTCRSHASKPHLPALADIVLGQRRPREGAGREPACYRARVPLGPGHVCDSAETVVSEEHVQGTPPPPFPQLLQSQLLQCIFVSMAMFASTMALVFGLSLQVWCLLDMATDTNILGRTWAGWRPYV